MWWLRYCGDLKPRSPRLDGALNGVFENLGKSLVKNADSAEKSAELAD